MPGESEEMLSISGLHEVEEDIWSPKWGLKGKVDASVQAAIVRKAAPKPKGPFATNNAFAGEASGSGVDDVIAPLEIKTGRAVGLMAHRAQTMLYTLLMEDRYGMFTSLVSGRGRRNPDHASGLWVLIHQVYPSPQVCCTTRSSTPFSASKPRRTRSGV